MSLPSGTGYKMNGDFAQFVFNDPGYLNMNIGYSVVPYYAYTMSDPSALTLNNFKFKNGIVSFNLQGNQSPFSRNIPSTFMWPYGTSEVWLLVIYIPCINATSYQWEKAKLRIVKVNK